MSVGLTTNYFSRGSGAPSGSPSVASGEFALYENTANGDLYEWNLSGTPGWTKIFDHAGGSGGGLYVGYVCMVESVSSGTAGGTAATSTWTTLPINTKTDDPGSICTLSSNQFTLAAGTYRIDVKQSLYDTGFSKLRLRNITGSATLLDGIGVYSGASTVGVPALLSGRFTVAASQALAIQYWATIGGSLGLQATSGDPEIHLIAELFLE